MTLGRQITGISVKNKKHHRCYTLLFWFVFLVCPDLFAQTVRSIQVQGQKKIEKDAIVEKIGVKVGQSLDLTQVQKDVRALFATGFFQDIEVSDSPATGGINLTYKVTEKPSVDGINYEGSSALDDDEPQEFT